MSEPEPDTRIEAALTAHRETDPEGRLAAPPAWWDLPPQALGELYEIQLQTRAMDRLLDPEGRSGTVKAVLARIGV